LELVGHGRAFTARGGAERVAGKQKARPALWLPGCFCGGLGQAALARGWPSWALQAPLPRWSVPWPARDLHGWPLALGRPHFPLGEVASEPTPAMVSSSAWRWRSLAASTAAPKSCSAWVLAGAGLGELAAAFGAGVGAALPLGSRSHST